MQPRSEASHSAIESVRRATRSRHVDLEGRPYSCALIERRLPYVAYAAHADCQLRYLRAVEARVASVTRGLVADIWQPHMARSGLLAADLTRMVQRGRPRVEAASAAERFVDDIERASDAELAGMVYVVEGSMLGARIIARHLEAGLGLGPDELTYMRADGPQLGPRWRGFVERFDGALATPADVEGAIDGARRAFDHIGDLLDVAWARASDAVHPRPGDGC